MHNLSSDRLIIALGDWLGTPAGLYVRSWEQQCLDQLTSDIFGFNALQIGLPQIDALAANRMPHRWLSDVHLRRQGEAGLADGARRIALVHDFNELPFPSQSLDLVVLPHVLEFAGEPHQILREVERVLIPEGQLIICGFNPASLWGARQGVGKLGGAPYLPRDGEFISLPRLKDWLKLLNMGINEAHFGCYAPPCSSEKWLNRFAFMEKAGPRWWPYFGAVYIVHAIKRIKGMHLIGPVWSRHTVNAAQGVTATNKNHIHQYK
jgi:SAM-dependent methyltransferase